MLTQHNIDNDNWMSAYEIARITHTAPVRIRCDLARLCTKMPNGAIDVTVRGKYYLNKEYFNKFLHKAGIKMYPHKDENWISAREIGHEIHTQHSKIHTLLIYLKPNMPDGAISYIRNKNMVSLCLNRQYLDEFCRMAGIIRHLNTDENWLSASEIGQKIHMHSNKIRQQLRVLKSKLPDGAIEIRKRYSKTAYYLHQDYLQEFYTQIQLLQKNDKGRYLNPKQLAKRFNTTPETISAFLTSLSAQMPSDAIIVTNQEPTLKEKYLMSFAEITGLMNTQQNIFYLSIDNIKQKLRTRHTEIYGLLKKCQPLLPDDAIITKQTKNRKIYMLRNDFLDKFCAVAGITIIPETNENWICGHEIARRLKIRHNNIPQILSEMKSKMPDGAIEHRRNKRTVNLYLNTKYLETFCQLSGLKKIAQKDENWMTPAEIAKKIKNSAKRMPTLLQEYRYKLPNGAIEFKRTGPKKTLCLNASYFMTFIQATGLPIHTNATDNQWITSHRIEDKLNMKRIGFKHILEYMQDKMPRGAIEYKKHSRKVALSLDVNYLDMLLDKAGITDKKSAQALIEKIIQSRSKTL